MNDLRQQLREILQGRVCVVGVGNVELGDDGAGVRIARIMSRVAPPGRSASVPGGSDVLGCRPVCSARGRAHSGSFMGTLAEAVGKYEIRNPKSETSPRLESQNLAIWRDAASFGVAVVVAGAEPERYVSRITEGLFDNVIFLDAVEFGGAPGDVVLLNAEEMAVRFPQFSTHKLSLGLLAQLIEAGGVSKAWLLGVQPESLREGGSLSPKVQASVELLARVVRGLSDEWRASVFECGNTPPLCRGRDGEFVLPGGVVACPEGARGLAHSKTLRAAEDRAPIHSALSTLWPALPC